jgi:hypothetical protein
VISLNLVLAGLRLGLKNRQVDEKWLGIYTAMIGNQAEIRVKTGAVYENIGSLTSIATLCGFMVSCFGFLRVDNDKEVILFIIVRDLCINRDD